MKNEKTKRRLFHNLVEQIKRDKVCFAVYAILRLLVILSLVVALLRGNYENAVLCVGTLILLLVPAFVERRFKIELPTVLEVVVMCFM